MGNYALGLLLHYFEGWHLVFYFCGIVTIVWCVLFHFICTNTPEDNPFIGEQEKYFLDQEVGQVGGKKNSETTPWRMILTSGPVIALTVACVSYHILHLHFASNLSPIKVCNNFGTAVLSIDLPKYMNDVLHFSVKDNGLYSSLPYVLNSTSGLVAGRLSDWLITSKKLSTTNTRKLMVVICKFRLELQPLQNSYSR